MANGIHIEGVDDCLRMFDNAPENAMKICRKAMRKGSAAAAKVIKSKVPPRYRKIVKYKVGRLPSGDLWARAGLYGKKLQKGTPKDDDPGFLWFKAYWANFGTLSRRDPAHQFMYKIKPKSKNRRQDVGQPAQHFFENAQKGWDEAFITAFQEEVKKNEDKLYDR